MRFAVVSSLLGLAACVWADTISVLVSQNGTLTFTPGSVNATEGDVIAFQFLAGNHTVTQSSFTDPCTMLASGIDSGFQPASDSITPQYNVTVTNTSTPMWFYCRQARHCQAGMVFAVNPTSNETYDAFKAMATGTNTSSSSLGSSSTRPAPSPSASGNSSYGAALGFDLPKLTGVISLVAILAGSAM